MKRKQYVLFDPSIKAYAGLNKLQITIEELQSKAVIFDDRDNLKLKVRTYNLLTGLKFEVKELNK